MFFLEKYTIFSWVDALKFPFLYLADKRSWKHSNLVNISIKKQVDLSPKLQNMVSTGVILCYNFVMFEPLLYYIYLLTKTPRTSPTHWQPRVEREHLHLSPPISLLMALSGNVWSLSIGFWSIGHFGDTLKISKEYTFSIFCHTL